MLYILVLTLAYRVLLDIRSVPPYQTVGIPVVRTPAVALLLARMGHAD